MTEEEETTIQQQQIMKTTSLQLVLTGASGYLGQHLLHNWIENFGSVTNDQYQKLNVIALYHKAEGFSEAVETHVAAKQQQYPSKLEVLVQSIDITDQTACQELKRQIEKEETATTVVIHTAALSSPRICTDEPEKAKALNIPTYFFNIIKDYPTVALSTDQVYDGKQNPGNLYKESDVESIKPVNIYGQTKLDMEDYLMKNKNNNNNNNNARNKFLFILRSSIILGPRGPYGCGVHTTFLDFIQSRKGEATTFFTNEYRSVVSLQFVVNVINDIIRYIITPKEKKQEEDDNIPIIYNMGGPNRVNRYDMAKSVFDHLKYDYDDTILIKAEQSSPSVPLDISMDSTLLTKYGFGSNSHPKTLSELVEYVFTASTKRTW
jgi:dTDP-4-dehydrorhamnose reductase